MTSQGTAQLLARLRILEEVDRCTDRSVRCARRGRTAPTPLRPPGLLPASPPEARSWKPNGAPSSRNRD